MTTNDGKSGRLQRPKLAVYTTKKEKKSGDKTISQQFLIFFTFRPCFIDIFITKRNSP